MEAAKDVLVTVVVPGVTTAPLGGVATGLTPLCLVPRGGGVPGVLRSARVTLPGGDRDFLLDYEEPVAPCTCEAVNLDESDFITASAIMKGCHL